MGFLERREFPRATESLPFEISLGLTTVQAQTQNISCGGVLCELSQPIPFLTKLGILLKLPNSGAEETNPPIHCKGVVVRQEPFPASNVLPSYRIAIYFSQMKLEDRRRIAEFVLKSMLAHSRRSS